MKKFVVAVFVSVVLVAVISVLPDDTGSAARLPYGNVAALALVLVICASLVGAISSFGDSDRRAKQLDLEKANSGSSEHE